MYKYKKIKRNILKNIFHSNDKRTRNPITSKSAPLMLNYLSGALTLTLFLFPF